MATIEEVLKEIAAGASGGDAVKGLLASLGIGERGLNTPAERQVLKGVMDNPNLALTKNWTFDVDGKTEGFTFTGDAMPDEVAVQKMRNAHNITADQTGVSTPAERDFIMKQQAFEAELIKLSPADLSSVLELFQGLSPQQKDTYMNHVLENGFDYGTINEKPLGRQQGFQQYNTGAGAGNISNLGFTGFTGYAP